MPSRDRRDFTTAMASRRKPDDPDPSDSPSALPYRPCVGLLLFNAERRVLIGQRTDSDRDAWQMPQGGIDPGETPRQAAMRELLEEVGTDKAAIVAEMGAWLTYDLPEDLRARLWHGRYRGQAQKWFALRFLGEDADINIATETPEFRAWRWSPLDEMIDLAVPFKRDVYARVIGEFAPLLARLRD